MMLAVQFLLGLLYANAGEWFTHKVILHGLGKNRRSFWAYHLYGHHADCAQHAMLDPGYIKPDFTSWNTQSKELVVLLGIALLHLPLLEFLPAFTAAVYMSLLLYYYRHRKAHIDTAWAKKHLRWHYEHHVSGDKGNWCITWPGFDYVMGTRVKTTTPPEP
jgi:hypothetical protein